MTTKEKITQVALFLFNRFGFVNVRLQYIADEVGLSVGNVAYHFKTKDDIMEHLYSRIVTEQQSLLTDLRMIPLFVNFDQHLQNVFEMQQRYSFFFTDTLEVMRAYPSIRKKHREHIQWQQIQFSLFLEFNVARGVLNSTVWPDSFQQLAKRYVLVVDSWLNYEFMQGNLIKDLPPSLFKEAIWSILVPYFTYQGTQEYKQMGI